MAAQSPANTRLQKKLPGKVMTESKRPRGVLLMQEEASTGRFSDGNWEMWVKKIPEFQG